MDWMDEMWEQKQQRMMMKCGKKSKHVETKQHIECEKTFNNGCLGS